MQRQTNPVRPPSVKKELEVLRQQNHEEKMQTNTVSRKGEEKATKKDGTWLLLKYPLQKTKEETDCRKPPIKMPMDESLRNAQLGPALPQSGLPKSNIVLTARGWPPWDSSFWSNQQPALATPVSSQLWIQHKTNVASFFYQLWKSLLECLCSLV